MCGIAGFSLSPDSSVDRTLAAQALLAGIAERGADAVGYAHRETAGDVRVTKLRGGASALLDELDVPPETSAALIHVRDFTKGHPEIEANNHPIRHGSVVGIHNGIIENDDELLARYGIERAEPQMTVDSEAIFALMEQRRHDARALSEMRGAMAAAWLDERDDATLYLARGRLRPLWLGRDRRRPLLRVHASRAHDRRRGAEDAPRRPRAARGPPAARRRRARRSAGAASGLIAATASPATCRPSVLHARPCRASSASRRSPQSAPPSVPSGRTSTPSSRSRPRTRYWNAVQAPRGTSSSR